MVLSHLQSKIRELEEQLREEVHQRKLVENKTAEVVSNHHYSNVLIQKVIWISSSFVKLCSVIGLENLSHHLNQSDAKLKPITTKLVTRVFPRFRQFGRFYFTFWIYDTQSKSALIIVATC